MANPQFFDNAYKFAFVRNPWDRVVSAYRYLCRGGNGSSDLPLSREIAQYKDLSDFVVNGLGHGLYRNHLLFLPQSEFVVSPEGRLAVDFIGRYEQLDEDCRIVLEKLGIQGDELVKTNEGESKEQYSNLYRKNGDVEIVGEIYRQDVNVFGYSF